MGRKSPTQTTLRALFAKSGNVCAFPTCDHELVADDNLYVGEVCHIEAAQPGGPRFNPTSNDEARRDFDNLLLLCHAHHRRVDSDVETYTVGRLRQMKAEHEAPASSEPYAVDKSVIDQVEREMALYWTEVAEHQATHPVPDLAVRLDLDAEAHDVFDNLRGEVERVRGFFDRFRASDDALPSDLTAFLIGLGYDTSALDAVPYFENPFEQRNWESHNIGSPNILTNLETLLLHAELLYLAEYLKLHAGDASAEARAGAIKEKLAEVAGSWGYVD